MELLDRYVAEVGKHLPRKNRADIENEIRSTLKDMIEDRSRETSRPVDERLVSEVLREYGSPETVADTYQNYHHLIGPKYYPAFVNVLQIAFVVYTIVRLVLLGVGLGFGANDIEAIASMFGNTVLGYLQGLIAVFGYVVIVFALLERFLPEESVSLGSEKKVWEPADLLKEPDANKISPLEQIFSILVIGGLLLLFNFYPDVIRVVYRAGEDTVTFPILAESFFRYLPWLNLAWGLNILLEIVLLRKGQWTGILRWSSIVLNLFGIGLLAAMLAGPELVAITSQTLTAASIPPATAETLAKLINQLVRMGLAFGVIANIFEIIKHIYRLFLQPAKPVSTLVK